MRAALRATTEAALKKVTDLIHDHWFCVDDVVFDERRRVLSIKFQRASLEGEVVAKYLLLLRRRRFPVTEWYLRLGRVNGYRLEDSQAIQRYDFNEVKYDRERRIVTILTGIPMVFELTVEELDLTLEETDVTVGWETKLTL